MSKLTTYNPEIPLISLHIPKCSGTSLSHSLHAANFSEKYRLLNYYPDIGINNLNDYNKANTIIHGHFVRWKNSAVEDIIENPSQFITIVRNPIDTLLSGYFYGKQNNFEWATNKSLEEFIIWHLENDISPIFGAVQKLTNESNPEDICSQFLIIKTINQLNEFVEELSEMLNFGLPKIEHHNTTDKYSKKISREIIQMSNLKYYNEINLINFLENRSYS